MITENKFALTPKEFQEKRYEVAKAILANSITERILERDSDSKQNEHIIYHCVQLADSFLQQLGYYKTTKNPEDQTSIRNLKDILDSGEK